MDKKIDEIEIEEINLDIDDKYEVTLDISPSTDDILESLKIDQPISKEEEELRLEEVKEEGEIGYEKGGIVTEESNLLELGEELKEVSGLENIEMPQKVGFEAQEVEEAQEEEGDISLSVEELDSILSEAKVEEVPSEDVALTISEEEEAKEEEKLSTEISSVDFSASEEAIRFEEEKLSTEKGVVEDLGDVVVMDSEGFNKVVSEELPPIEEKPAEIEEETKTVGFEEEFSFGEAVSPGELGIGEEKKEEFEFSEFAEITEEMVEEQKLNVVEGGEEVFVGVSEEVPLEISETREEAIGEFEEIGEIGLGEMELGGLKEESVTKERVEVFDDISISKEEYGIVEEIPEAIEIDEEVKYSVTPKEVGIEEIEVAPEVETSGIVGIGFEEEAKEKVEDKTRGAEEVISFVEESIGLPEVEEETLSIGEREAKIEEAIEGLSDVEREALRKVLKYLDKLLESLPEEKVKEFASSEYYDLYVRLFDKLNIK